MAGLTGGWQSYQYFMALINCRLESGDRFEFNVVPNGERLAAPFDVAEGVTIQPGTYRFTRFRLEAGLAPKRRFNAQATWWFGRFYDGYLDQYEITRSAWKPSSLVIVEFSGSTTWAGCRKATSRRTSSAPECASMCLPDLQLTSLVQYDNVSHALGTNTRLRWTFDPLGDLFVVYNHNVSRLTGDWTFAGNELLVKAQYVFRDVRRSMEPCRAGQQVPDPP